MDKVDVVVVGAGLAGLTAARELAAHGRAVRVLEARDRVGGRTDHHVTRHGEVLEMGGQWVGPTQDEVLGLITELGLELYPQHTAGERLQVMRGSANASSTEARHLLADVGDEMVKVQRDLEAMAATVSLSSPWLTGDAAAWDAAPLDSWLVDRVADPVVLQYWRTLVVALFAAEATEMSLLHFLFYIKSGGLLEMLVGVEGGAQESRVVGGSHLISERLAADLGDAVRLECPVNHIEQDDEGVLVTHAGGQVWADRVVVALPPTLAGRVTYQPPLPARRDGLTQQVPMGSVIKVQVIYDRPFWRDAGLSGDVFSTRDPISVVVDSTPHGSAHGSVACFIEGRHARAASELSRDERRELVTECLVRYFGPPAADVVEYAERDWTEEEFSRGCYGGRLGTGVWTEYGRALAEPVQRIHWAGAETAAVWNGYMDGAVRSGQRAAAEVLAVLPTP